MLKSQEDNELVPFGDALMTACAVGFSIANWHS